MDKGGTISVRHRRGFLVRYEFRWHVTDYIPAGILARVESLGEGGELASVVYNLCQYDYLDIGCGEGLSLHFGRDKFLGQKGIGIDLDP